jgi:F-box protein, helicase, 18
MRPTHSIGRTEKFRNLTNEQGMAAISPATSLKIVAPAGSGKTHVQMAYAAARPMKRGLYLALSKPNQIEAEARLTALSVNTVAKTCYSLAWQFGRLLHNAGKLSQPGLRAATTARALNVNYAMAAAINQTVTNFMNSAEGNISEAHLPSERDAPIASRNQGPVIEGTRQLWARMVNPADPETQATHDVYLKQWAMAGLRLDYDFILFDEYQDATPLLAKLINDQKHCSRVYVGDPHQAIYGFRGAANLMDELQAEAIMALTASFRFPPNVGLMASTFLKHWKKNTIQVIGKGKVEARMPTDQQAFVSRTVAGLTAKGFELHCAGKRMHWIKGFENYKVKPIMEAYALYKGKTEGLTDPVLKMMPSWAAFKEYVEATRDGEAGSVYRLVEKYKHDLPVIISELKANEVKEEKNASFVLATAHGSKGREWPTVSLTDDFFSFRNDKDGKKTWMQPDEINPQEANLMYVALTRARKEVAPTPEIADWFAERPETAHLFPGPCDPESAKRYSSRLVAS